MKVISSIVAALFLTVAASAAPKTDIVIYEQRVSIQVGLKEFMTDLDGKLYGVRIWKAPDMLSHDISSDGVDYADNYNKKRMTKEQAAKEWRNLQKEFKQVQKGISIRILGVPERASK